MCQYSVVQEDGVPGDWRQIHDAARAVGGFGLLIVEATAVVPEGRVSPRDTGLWDARQTAAWARTIGILHGLGALVGVQLAHAGRKASTYWSWSGKGGTVSIDDGGWRAVAPSPIPFPGYDDPRELTTGEIARIVTAFGAAATRAAATRADDAGFDVVEIHAAHGYLIHECGRGRSGGSVPGRGTDPARARRCRRAVVVRLSVQVDRQGRPTVSSAAPQAAAEKGARSRGKKVGITLAALVVIAVAVLRPGGSAASRRR